MVSAINGQRQRAEAADADAPTTAPAHTATDADTPTTAPARDLGIRAVVIDSAFYSYRAIAKDKARAIDANLATEAWIDALIPDDHSPGPLIAQIAPIPLLIIHATADPIIPYAHGQRLYKEAKEPKEFWTIEGGGHTAAFAEGNIEYRSRLVEWLQEKLQGDRETSGDTGDRQK